MREMKDSGLEWIGAIPTIWKLSKIDSVYHLRNTKVSDRDYMPLSVTMSGIVPQLESAAKTNAHDDRKLVKKGDFAINSRSDRRGSCGISAYDGSVSLINTVLAPVEQVNPGYFDWLFHTTQFGDEFYKWGHGIVDDLWTTGWQDMRKIVIPMPSVEEQGLIADFLDAKCAEVDSLAADIQTQIDTLEEYKRSVITETLFAGDYPYTKMKYVGVFQNGMNFASKLAEREVPFLGVGDFQNNMVISGKEAFSSIMYDGVIPSNALLKNDDIVFVRSNGSKSLVGRSVLVRNIDFELTYSGFCIRFRKQRLDFDSKFILYAMWSNKFREVIDSFTRGTNITNVSQDMLKNVLIPEIPLNKQFEIVKKLDEICAEIDAVILGKNKQRDILCEYKKSLIYEYVTGKKEVPADGE